MSDLNSVVISKKVDGSWQAHHVPSDRYTFGDNPEDAQEAMRVLLGLNEEGRAEEPTTSQRFDGVVRDIAVFLEGPVSQMLAFHSGFARLESFEDGVAYVRLGGGCKGCPSSLFTLLNGVRSQVQDQFGADVVKDIVPHADSF